MCSYCQLLVGVDLRTACKLSVRTWAWASWPQISSLTLCRWCATLLSDPTGAPAANFTEALSHKKRLREIPQCRFFPPLHLLNSNKWRFEYTKKLSPTSVLQHYCQTLVLTLVFPAKEMPQRSESSKCTQCGSNTVKKKKPVKIRSSFNSPQVPTRTAIL